MGVKDVWKAGGEQPEEPADEVEERDLRRELRERNLEQKLLPPNVLLFEEGIAAPPPTARQWEEDVTHPSGFKTPNGSQKSVGEENEGGI